MHFHYFPSSIIEAVDEEKIIKARAQYDNETLRTHPRWGRASTSCRAQKEIMYHILVNNIDGDIVELGCGAGENTFYFARVIKESEYASQDRKVYGFDNFRGYLESDIKISEEKFHPRVTLGLKSNMHQKRWDIDPQIVKNKFRNSSIIEIVEGDIQTTTKQFEPKSGAISLLYIDCNAYTPAIEAINNLKKYFSKGALVFIDGGFCPPDLFLDGEKAALLEYSQADNLPMFRTHFGNFAAFFVEVK